MVGGNGSGSVVTRAGSENVSAGPWNKGLQ